MAVDWSWWLLSLIAFVSVPTCSAQSQEMPLIPQMRTQIIVKPPDVDLFQQSYLKEIPKHFELKGPNKGATRDFQRYIEDIELLAQEKNLTVVYKVKIETSKPIYSQKPSTPKKLWRRKKFNTPLKKPRKINLELSSKKISEENVQVEEMLKLITTPRIIEKLTTKSKFNGKYKPLIHKGRQVARPNKGVKPIRKKEFKIRDDSIWTH